MQKKINDAAQLRLLKHKVPGRCVVSFCGHIGEGYFVTTFYCRHVLDFRQLYELRDRKMRMTYNSGISINLEDECDELMHYVIPTIHCHYQSLPTLSQEENFSTKTSAIWGRVILKTVTATATD